MKERELPCLPKPNTGNYFETNNYILQIYSLLQ